MAVIPSGVRNEATRQAATSTGRPKAERAGSERIKSLDVSEETRDISISLEMTRRLFATLDVYRDDATASAAMNMAVDEALLEHATVASIRFYRWHAPSLSFGYFGKFTDVGPYAPTHDLVRRWTGGGIVFHGSDLTYSIVIPATDRVFAESSMTIYERIHRALADALKGIGTHAVVAGGVDPGSGSVEVAPTRTGISDAGYSCFANPVPADVMLNGRKIAGAAQRRTRRGLLQQGSIQGVALENDLAERFAYALSVNCSEREIGKNILDRARELAQGKYGTTAWLRRR